MTLDELERVVLENRHEFVDNATAELLLGSGPEIVDLLRAALSGPTNRTGQWVEDVYLAGQALKSSLDVT